MPSPPLVLLVDEDARSARLLARLLREDGYAVEVERNGASALRRLDATPTLDAVIVTDDRMPFADGLAVVRASKTRDAAIPVFIVTAYPELFDDAALPRSQVFTKPLFYAALTAALGIATQSASSQETLMSKSNQVQARSRVLLVGVDFSESSVSAIDAALDLAATEGSTAVLHALVVDEMSVGLVIPFVHSTSQALIESVDRLRALLVERVGAASARHRTLHIQYAQAHGASGSPARELAHLAAELNADLVVVGSHGRRGLERALLGSVAEMAVRLCGCPVLVVRAKAHAELDGLPDIEPMCPQCADRRRETEGVELWCARHSEHHPRAHAYSYEGPSYDTARPWGFDS